MTTNEKQKQNRNEKRLVRKTLGVRVSEGSKQHIIRCCFDFSDLAIEEVLEIAARSEAIKFQNRARSKGEAYLTRLSKQGEIVIKVQSPNTKAIDPSKLSLEALIDALRNKGLDDNEILAILKQQSD